MSFDPSVVRTFGTLALIFYPILLKKIEQFRNKKKVKTKTEIQDEAIEKALDLTNSLDEKIIIDGDSPELIKVLVTKIEFQQESALYYRGKYHEVLEKNKELREQNARYQKQKDKYKSDLFGPGCNRLHKSVGTRPPRRTPRSSLREET